MEIIKLKKDQYLEAIKLAYKYFDKFTEMLDNEKYFIRARGFRLICKNAKWDKFMGSLAILFMYAIVIGVILVEETKKILTPMIPPEVYEQIVNGNN